MKSQRRRRPVRPLTIYGFRRGRPRYHGVWLALVLLASLSVLPRVLSPIAEKFWGAPQKANPSAQAVSAQPRPSPEAGSAFAAPEPEPANAADTMEIVIPADTVATTARAQITPPSSSRSGSGAAPAAHPPAHRTRRKTAAATSSAPSDPAPSEASPPPSRPRLVPPPR